MSIETDRQVHNDDGRFLRIGRNRKAKLAAHVQHRDVFAQDLAANRAQAFGVRIFDHQLHQEPAEPVALQVGADEDGVFAVVEIGVGVDAHDAEHFATRLVDGDESHGAGIIDLGKARDEGMAEFLYRREEAQAQVLLASPRRRTAR